ncbi:MAG TPA: GreA/GreB family elongation factor [Methylomirabilota bacterium]|nr:GreA/GreB family elongation factor [Methylomirabilota bacterium]
MREEFEKLAAAGKISPKHIETLTTLAQTGYCVHRSWGFGRITTVDTVFARFLIDFPNKPGHQMDLGFSAESLKPVSPDHILAKKASDLEGLRKLAALDHLAVIKLVLRSYGGKATVDQIQQVLVPDVITSDWKKWWEVAKRELKKDGHFQILPKKTDPIVYQEQEVSLQDRLLKEFRAAKGLKAHTAVAVEALKVFSDLSDKTAAVDEINGVLNTEIATHTRNQPSVAMEAMFVRDDLRQAAGTPPPPGEITPKDIWAQEPRFSAFMESLPAAKHRRALETFKESTPLWAEAVRVGLSAASAKLSGELASMLIANGKVELLKETLAKLINQHNATSELLLWLAKERSDAFADILGPEVFRAMLTAMERDQFNEKKSNRLRDYILDDQSLLVELIGSADLEVIKDLTRALQLSPVFDDMDKRSLLARIVKSYPAIQSLITGDQTRQETSFVVSWDSLARRKDEYAELVQKKIPANSKEIAIARSYGDLRENHEYKAAKEMQKILMRRKGELESQIVRARGADFANARTDVVSIGTHVRLTDLASQEAEQFIVLGAWDSDPEKHVISYLTPVAQKLINKKIGEDVELETENGTRRYRIDSIEQAQPAPVPAPVAETASA